MSSESNTDQKVVVSKAVSHVGAPPPEPEPLKCPRCESSNTKFCYYNNYNFSQPRHFCKGCRRYWTHGGTLRDIPVGGGSRKNAKRSRTMATAASSSPVTSASGGTNSVYDYRRVSSPAPLSVIPGGNIPMILAGDGKLGGGLCGSFSSLLGTHGPGFFNLNGFGLGLQTGHDDMGFGLGRSTWPFVGGFAVPDSGVSGVGGGGGQSMVPNAWQLQGAEGGLLGGDCFALSDHIGFARTGHALN